MRLTVNKDLAKPGLKPDVLRVDLHWGPRGLEAIFATVEEDTAQHAWLADGDVGPFDSWYDVLGVVSRALSLRYGSPGR